MNYLFLITGLLLGIVIGMVAGMFVTLWGVKEGAIKEFYYIPFKSHESELYAIKAGKFERITDIPKGEEQ